MGLAPTLFPQTTGCFSIQLRERNGKATRRSEEHTSELQSQSNLVCRLLLEKKKREAHDSVDARIHALLHPGRDPGRRPAAAPASKVQRPLARFLHPGPALDPRPGRAQYSLG